MSSIPGKKYFASVIYNHPAHGWSAATDDQILSLEVTEHIDHLLKSWDYDKIYYQEKDALPGKDIFDELFEVINGSEWIIVVLTKDFLDKDWNVYCQKSAFKRLLDKHERRKLLPIAINLNDSSIPNNLNINGILHIDGEWKNNPGWEKLKRVLDGESVTDTQPPAPSDAVLTYAIQETQDENPHIHSEIGDRSLMQSTRGVSGNGRTSSGISPPESDLGNDGAANNLNQTPDVRMMPCNPHEPCHTSTQVNTHGHNSDIEEDYLSNTRQIPSSSENVSRIGWINDRSVNQVSSSTDSEESESDVSETVPKSYEMEQPSGYFAMNEVTSTPQPDCHEKKVDTSAEEKTSPWKKCLLNSLVHLVSKSEMPFM